MLAEAPAGAAVGTAIDGPTHFRRVTVPGLRFAAVCRCRNVRAPFVIMTRPDSAARVTTVIRKPMTSSPYAADAALAQCAGENYNTVQFSYLNARFDAFPHRSDRSSA
jgi:hypothetical protein